MFPQLPELIQQTLHSAHSLGSETSPGVQALGFLLFPEFALIAMTCQAPNLFWQFALLAVAGSLVGATVDYLIGLRGGRTLFERKVPVNHRQRIDAFFERYGVWTLVVGSFVPISYKLLTLATGVIRMSWSHFLLGAFAGRSLRFFAIGGVIHLFGESVVKHLSEVSLGLLAVLLVAAPVLWILWKRSLVKQSMEKVTQ